MSSMGQDVIKGRASEIRCVNGFVVDWARELGLDLPATEAIVDAMLAVDADHRKPARSNIDRTLERAGIIVPAVV